PVVALVAGLAVDASYLVSAHRAGMSTLALFQGTTFLLQAVLMAAVMVVVRRAGGEGEATLAGCAEPARAGAMQHAGRVVERHYLRLLHNGPLTTLTIAGSGNLAGRGLDALRQRAALDAATLRTALTSLAADGEAVARLDGQLALVACQHEPPL